MKMCVACYFSNTWQVSLNLKYNFINMLNMINTEDSSSFVRIKKKLYIF